MNPLLRSDDYFLDETVPLAIHEICHGESRYAIHRHEFTEFAVVVSGRGRHILDGQATDLRSGDCYVIAPGRTHGFEGLEDFSVINVLFLEKAILNRLPELAGVGGYRGLLHWEVASRRRGSGDAVARVGSGNGPATHGLPVRPDMDSFDFIVLQLRRIAGELRSGRPGAVTCSVFALGQVMVELCRAFTAADAASSGRFGSLERAIVWVELHYSERFSLGELARSAALSPATLNRRFRELMDCTPMDYVRKERLRRATLLLGDRSLNLGLAELAGRCGFVDAPHFSRLFRQAYGMSPCEWRRGLASASPPI